MTRTRESIIETVQHIDALAREELQVYIGEKIMTAMLNTKNDQYALKLDSVTLFAHTQSDAARLNEEASRLGEVFYRKNGLFYAMDESASPVPYVRITDLASEADSTKLGGAEYALGYEAFPKAKELIITNAPNYQIRARTARKPEQDGQAIAYTYIQVDNPSSQVIPTCLSRSFVQIVR